MSGQIGFCYSANRLAEKPFRTVLHTSFGPTASPRVWGKMTTRGWQHWTRCHWREQGIDAVAKAVQVNHAGSVKPIDSDMTGSMESEGDGKDLMRYLAGSVLPSTITPEHTLVYLSADAEEELTTLSENEIYIIGGVVDRNRYKVSPACSPSSHAQQQYMCQKKADGLGIRTARLPIGTFLAEMPTRKVLTVNQVCAVNLVCVGETTTHPQVFEILTKYLSLNDWRKAFEAVIPNRKYDELGKKALRRQERRAKFAAGNPTGDPNAAEAASDSDDDDDDTDAEDHECLAEDSDMDKDADPAHVEDSLAADAGHNRRHGTTGVDKELDEEESMNM